MFVECINKEKVLMGNTTRWVKWYLPMKGLQWQYRLKWSEEHKRFDAIFKVFQNSGEAKEMV